MTQDSEIARSVQPRPITEIAESLGLSADELRLYGSDVAKVELSALARGRRRPGQGRLVLVSAITPTPAGEGKTTTGIGLAQALARIGESACLALREPSLGPTFGMKGGATGGGHSQVIPMERINLHFTGDFHAITTAHNLLSAALDNHLQQGNVLRIDPRRVLWKRVLDMNDRALRQVTIGLGGTGNGLPRESGFDITAASEVMAMLCLAEGFDDLRIRIDRTLVGFSFEGEPIRAGQLGVTGAMLALLRDALMPNLVQTLEGTPALIHGGPFANIAHGCSSVLATRMALALADWTITEAGFGFDLGAEKFFDIKCAGSGLVPAAVVLVATLRALKMHGGVLRKDLERPAPEAVRRGLPNLEKHIESARAFGLEPIVAINAFASDSQAETEVVRIFCQEAGVPFAISEHHARGGAGAEALARVLVESTPAASSASPGSAGSGFRPLYQRAAPIREKILTVARTMYGASDVAFTNRAEKNLREIEALGHGDLPVCIAKVPGSLSDDPSLRGRPRDFEITVREIQISSGAGFVVVLTGDIVRMPGLPRKPRAELIDLDASGRITGLE